MSLIFALLYLSSQVADQYESRIEEIRENNIESAYALVDEVCKRDDAADVTGRITMQLISINNEASNYTIRNLRACSIKDKQEEKSTFEKKRDNPFFEVESKTSEKLIIERNVTYVSDIEKLHKASIYYGIGGGFIAIGTVGAFGLIIGTIGNAILISQVPSEYMGYLIVSNLASAAIVAIDFAVGILLFYNGHEVLSN